MAVVKLKELKEAAHERSISHERKLSMNGFKENIPDACGLLGQMRYGQGGYIKIRCIPRPYCHVFTVMTTDEISTTIRYPTSDTKCHRD
jgi:hypothetical protein